MREVSDVFLLTMAEVSATLIGLFLVGVFFYVETGLRRWGEARSTFETYLRAGTRITLLVFAIPIALSLSLVALEPVWSRVLFAFLSVLLVVANVDTVLRVRGVSSAIQSGMFFVLEVVTSVLSVLLVVLPWVLGGLHPTREDLTWAILLAFVAGFLSIGTTVMSVFDAAHLESDAGD
ncbi:MAG: hypothetical protein ACRDKJ_11360 [Actinomycetota bacterium]